MAISASKAEMLENLKGLLRDVFRLRAEGAQYARLARAQGYVDGYMRVLLDSGIAEQRELLALVSSERRQMDGPATCEVDHDIANVA